jgi:hypothetical protein
MLGIEDQRATARTIGSGADSGISCSDAHRFEASTRRELYEWGRAHRGATGISESGTPGQRAAAVVRGEGDRTGTGAGDAPRCRRSARQPRAQLGLSDAPLVQGSD